MKHDHEGFDRDEFDWMETLTEAGIPSKCRDLSHLPTAEIVALLAAEQQAATDLAQSVGLPQEADALGQPIPVAMTDEARGNLLAAINAVPVAKDHLAAVMRIIDLIPLPMKLAGSAPANTVLEYVGDQNIADPDLPRPLLARAIALSRWRADHGRQAGADDAILIEAASQAPVISTDGLPAFEATAFSELAEFLADLPW